ncbi:early light-induced protein, chloroplastic-like [Papaver somniferum]|uniref:early light-induced protein, chloroplastic-like n=1 Tax=Papaver somniferum TaxID=3469 RepID=UPI000E6F7FCE|nr:early light-induced protein, chloroplastic-like [Papaver somniferum]
MVLDNGQFNPGILKADIVKFTSDCEIRMIGDVIVSIFGGMGIASNFLTEVMVVLRACEWAILYYFRKIYIRTNSKAVMASSMYGNLPWVFFSLFFGSTVVSLDKHAQQPASTPMTDNTINTTPPSPVATLSSPPPQPKMSTKFKDLLALGGPVPERINSRSACHGTVASMGVELARGTDLATQLTNRGILWFIGTSVVLSLASLIPLSKGISVESESDGVMTSKAELWKGRFAMLGFVALVFTEFVTGSASV